MKKKQTAGSKIKEHLEKSTDTYLVNINDITHEAGKEYLRNLSWCINHALKKIDCMHLEGHKETCENRTAYSTDFYVVVLSKREKALNFTIRNYFISSLSCPTPSFDQSVYLYRYETGDIEYLWTVPDKGTALFLRYNKDIIPKEYHELLGFVCDFFDGKLLQIAKILNKESAASFKIVH